MHPTLPKLAASPWTAAALTFVLASGISTYLIHAEDQTYQSRVTERVAIRVESVRANLQRELDLDLVPLYALQALVAADQDIPDAEFQRISAALTSTQAAVLEIQLAPEGVVRHVYPAADAPQVLGLDVLHLPGQADVARETVASGKPRVAGPTALVQGGTALIARDPIYVGEGSERRFWGFITVLLDYPRFLQALPSLAKDPDVELALRGKDGLGAKGAPFYGPADLFADKPITAEVQLPGGSWQLAGRPREGWRTAPGYSTAARLLAVLFVLGMSILAYVARARGNTILRIATFDVLTGYLRRHAFIERANEEIERAIRYQRPLSLLLLDVDHFKQVNDRWGHAAGDAALIAVTSRIQKSLRPSDLAGRVGGEEFALLCPETDLAQALALAERLRSGVAMAPARLGSASVLLHISIGVVPFQGAEDSLQAMLSDADKALYRAKSAGRDRVVAGRT